MKVSSKDLKYLALCSFGARLFSTCSKRQYMAIVLDENGRLTGMGYNGAPPGQPHCIDGHCPRVQQNSVSGSSYDNCISVHAEQNAIIYSGNRHTLYVNGMPCSTCAKLIAGAGFTRLVGIEDKSYVASEESIAMLRASGIEVLLADADEVFACTPDMSLLVSAPLGS